MPKKRKEEVNIVYQIIYEKLKEVAVLGEISKKKINFCLGVIFHIPKEYRSLIIKNFEKLELIKLKNGWGMYYLVGDEVKKAKK